MSWECVDFVNRLPQEEHPVVELLWEPSLGPFGRSHLQEGNQGSPGRFDSGVGPDQVFDQTFTDPSSFDPGSMCLPRLFRSYTTVRAFAVDFFSLHVCIAAACRLWCFPLAVTTMGSLQKRR